MDGSKVLIKMGGYLCSVCYRFFAGRSEKSYAQAYKCCGERETSDDRAERNTGVENSD